MRCRRTKSTCWCIRSRWCTGWSNSATARWSRSSARPTCAFRSPIVWPGRSASMGRRRGSTWPKVRQLTFEAPDLERFPALALARRAHGDGRGGADGAQCGQRGRGRRIYCRTASHFRRLRRWWRRHLMRLRSAVYWPNRPESMRRIAIDHVARSLARDLLPEIAVKAS